MLSRILDLLTWRTLDTSVDHGQWMTGLRDPGREGLVCGHPAL